MSEIINVIIACFDGKLQKMLVDLAHISTHNHLQIDLNTRFFCYFFQIGIRLGKQSGHSYVDNKLL